MASAAMHKPPSRWTVVAAFILPAVLHAGAVMWIEVQEKPPVEVDTPVPIHSVEKVTFEMGVGSRLADA